MESRVTSKLRQMTATDPLGRTTDPWAAFREVEILSLQWTQEYRHSLGKVSRFFLALEEGKLLATRCPSCGNVWMPPRPLCPTHREVTEWVELSGKGRLITWSVIHGRSQGAPHLQPPYVFAYVALEGATTLFGNVLRNVADPANLVHGMPVRTVFVDGPVTHPLHLIAFEIDAP